MKDPDSTDRLMQCVKQAMPLFSVSVRYFYVLPVTDLFCKQLGVVHFFSFTDTVYFVLLLLLQLLFFV